MAQAGRPRTEEGYTAIAAPIHTGERSIDRVLGTGVPVLLVFRARRCPPCDQLDPALDRLAAEYAGSALIAKVDARDEPALARRYGVTHLPGLVFVQDKAPVGRAGPPPRTRCAPGWPTWLAAGRAPRCPQGRAFPSTGWVFGRHLRPRAPRRPRRDPLAPRLP